MATTQTATAPPAYDNNGQYSRSGILRYERIFGDGYVSTGGPETTSNLCARLGSALRPGARVLDVGSGIGGAAFYLAKTFAARVTGIDLSPEMTQIALDRAATTTDLGKGSAQFLLGDILTTAFPHRFDLLWSRDALMHLPDKPLLFSRLFDLLDNGGQLIITDYARGRTPGSPEFEAYASKTGYHLVEPAAYGKLLEAAGFQDVKVVDATDQFRDIMRREAERLEANRASFLSSFSADDLNYLLARWAMKDRFCQDGDMKWGIFQATKRG
jgi:phosphoethanolamine N-methyltransferase